MKNNLFKSKIFGLLPIFFVMPLTLIPFATISAATNQTPPTKLNYTVKDTSHIEGEDGEIKITNHLFADYELVYKENIDTVWIKFPVGGTIDGLDEGTYEFKWISTKGKSEVLADAITVFDSQKIEKPKLIPVIVKTDITTNGNKDGIITITNHIEAYSILQYSIKGSNKWINVPHNGIIDNLGPNTYIFQWTSKNIISYSDNTTTVALSTQIIIQEPAIPDKDNDDKENKKSNEKTKDNRGIIIGSTIGGIAIISIITFLISWLKKKK